MFFNALWSGKPSLHEFLSVSTPYIFYMHATIASFGVGSSKFRCLKQDICQGGYFCYREDSAVWQIYSLQDSLAQEPSYFLSQGSSQLRKQRVEGNFYGILQEYSDSMIFHFTINFTSS